MPTNNEQVAFLLGYIHVPAAETFIDWDYIEKNFKRFSNPAMDLLDKTTILRRDSNSIRLVKHLNEPVDADESFKKEVLFVTTVLIHGVRQTYAGDFIVAYGYRQLGWDWRIEAAAMIAKESNAH